MVQNRFKLVSQMTILFFFLISVSNGSVKAEKSNFIFGYWKNSRSDSVFYFYVEGGPKKAILRFGIADWEMRYTKCFLENGKDFICDGVRTVNVLLINKNKMKLYVYPDNRGLRNSLGDIPDHDNFTYTLERENF